MKEEGARRRAGAKESSMRARAVHSSVTCDGETVSVQRGRVEGRAGVARVKGEGKGRRAEESGVRVLEIALRLGSRKRSPGIWGLHEVAVPYAVICRAAAARRLAVTPTAKCRHSARAELL
eukprot:3940347-Rhodomonas_salina.3